MTNEKLTPEMMEKENTEFEQSHSNGELSDEALSEVAGGSERWWEWDSNTTQNNTTTDAVTYDIKVM